MSFTSITVTGTFLREDGTPSQGTVTAALSCAVQNGVDRVEPNPVAGVLNAAGDLVALSLQPFVLVANDDTGTQPANSCYTFALQIDGAPLDTFDAVVPSASPGQTVDITALEVLS
jgi:hypothetical protein